MTDRLPRRPGRRRRHDAAGAQQHRLSLADVAPTAVHACQTPRECGQQADRGSARSRVAGEGLVEHGPVRDGVADQKLEGGVSIVGEEQPSRLDQSIDTARLQQRRTVLPAELGDQPAITASTETRSAVSGSPAAT